MANRIQIRHGAGAPDIINNPNSLLPYELGWDTTSKALYINDNGILTSLSSGSGTSIIAGTGLQFNSNTLNHSNSITPKTTQAFYPITIDAQGHITSAGNATTIRENRVFYGTCDTPAATTEKIVICTDYDSLQAGDIVNVKFINTNSADVANLTLNVNNTGAISIKKAYNHDIDNLSDKAEISASYTCMFIYNVNSDSTSNWILCNVDYNTNTNTLLRTYSSATNIEVPLIAQSSAASTTAAWTSYTDTYKAWYGVIPNIDSLRAKINLSTGHITIPGGVTSVTPTIGDNSTLVATTAFVNTAINNAIGAAIGGNY